MSRRLKRFGLLVLGLLASEVWALGLGDIRLDSALNEPLRAEIELLSASDEELDNLKITLASAETFERYGIDRPIFLTRLQFSVVNGGSGRVIRVTSSEPVSEPFVTFLVEANWPRGRLLREYTVLLDPPTFAPPPRSGAGEAVSAPRQSTQADRGRIERPAPAAATPSPSPRPAAPAAAPAASFDTGSPGDYQVARGDTLWRIAEQLRPDSRLSMNQTMLAIYEANPGAFAGNINELRANTRLRIPSADEIFSIGRAQALNEIRRQNAAWGGGAATPQATAQTTLTLVPPDEDEQAPYRGAAGSDAAAATSAAAQERIRQLETQIAEQDSLLEIRDNELAELRSELARLREARGEAQPAEPPVADDAVAADDTPAESADEIFVEDQGDATPADTAADEAVDTVAPPAPRVVAPPTREAPGLVDQIIGILTGFWGIVGAALVAVLGLLVWFARRASGRGDESDTTGVWDALDADADSESVASTERLRAMARDDDSSIVVVEQAAAEDTLAGDTIESPSMYADADDDSGDISAPEFEPQPDVAPASLEDTFSSETAINLDQSDPVAEADFHMAYGLYDQAADLINGALAVEPNRSDLMAKLCEIYFVWGNRDAFVDAAARLQDAVGDDSGSVWDKVVIMGQQIAGDHALFADARAGGGTHAVDLEFEGGGEAAALDIDFAGGSMDDDSGVIDLGEEEAALAGADDDALDFSFDDDTDTGASITREMTHEMPTDVGDEPTIESPSLSEQTLDDTLESPTVEQSLDSLAETAELRSGAGDDTANQPRVGEATAEIDLDDLGLDLDSLADGLEGDVDLLGDDDTDTDLGDRLAETGRNEQLGDDFFSKTDANIKPDEDLLDATGQTQVLSDDFTVETASNLKALEDDDATMLAPGPGAADSETGEFDFAKTEALPKESFGEDSLAETAEQPAPGSTDMDLDLDDLTAALQLSESGDTVEQNRDDATVEQPRFGGDSTDLDLDLGLDADDATQALGPDDVSEDLQEARTMTEVGTKLDLARAYVDMGDPSGARNILEEVLEEGDESQRQQAQQLLNSLPG